MYTNGMRVQALALRGVAGNYIFGEQVGPDVERCDIFGKKYAQTLRGVTMTCQTRKELRLAFEK